MGSDDVENECKRSIHEVEMLERKKMKLKDCFAATANACREKAGFTYLKRRA